jgi:predicted glycoside hydrolase/deacetylase ChbG (UPF0249 family)
MSIDRQAYSRVILMITSTLQFLDGHEADECDCPACMPACERTGKKCFITCDRCRAKVEADDIGPLKCTTRHLQYTASTSRQRFIAVSPEVRELEHLLKAIEAQAEVARSR